MNCINFGSECYGSTDTTIINETDKYIEFKCNKCGSIMKFWK